MPVRTLAQVEWLLGRPELTAFISVSVIPNCDLNVNDFWGGKLVPAVKSLSKPYLKQLFLADIRRHCIYDIIAPLPMSYQEITLLQLHPIKFDLHYEIAWPS